jgi:hypothetical protein
VKIEEVEHRKANCPTHYAAGHKGESKAKKESIKASCSFVDQNINKAFDSLDPSEMNFALNKFVGLAQPTNVAIGMVDAMFTLIYYFILNN